MVETFVEDTYCEAFPAWVSRIVISAETIEWARHAATSAVGFATSVIGCGIEAGIEKAPVTAPDERPAVAVIFAGMKKDSVAKAVATRVGQCVLTCATTSAYDGHRDRTDGITFALGKSLRYFGDGYQMSKVIAGRRIWRIPVMDGEFVVDDMMTVSPGVAGGNLILIGPRGLLLSEVPAIQEEMQGSGVILPFPGGVVRSGSKVGSKYRFMSASTNHAYVPGLRSLSDNVLPQSYIAYEIVVDGVSDEAVRASLIRGLHRARQRIPIVSAGNYGGRLGPYQYRLHDLVQEDPA